MALFDIREEDWLRVSRWCLLGALAMVVWLMVPVAKCSYRAFADTSVGEVQQDDPSSADKERLNSGKGFVSRVVDSTKICYAKTPLFGQEAWKGNVLTALLAAVVFSRLIRWYLMSRRKRSLD